MISVHLRPISDDGVAGEAIGTAFRRDDRVIYEGSALIRDLISAMMERFRIDETTALARLAVDGWCNGKMVVASDAA